MLKLSAALALVALCAGCTATTGRWAEANTENLVIEGEVYKVLWKKTADGIDAYGSQNTAFTLLPDKLEQKRRSTDAMRQIAIRECGSEVAVITETEIELTFQAQFRCVPPVPPPVKPASRRRQP